MEEEGTYRSPVSLHLGSSSNLKSALTPTTQKHSLCTFINEPQFDHQSNQTAIFDFPTELAFKHVVVTIISPFLLLSGPILPGSLPSRTCPAGGGKKDRSELTLRASTYFCIASNSFNILNPSILTTSSIFFPCGPGGLPHKYMTRFLTSGE
jgi:hypothetical protein